MEVSSSDPPAFTVVVDLLPAVAVVQSRKQVAHLEILKYFGQFVQLMLHGFSQGATHVTKDRRCQVLQVGKRT